MRRLDDAVMELRVCPSGTLFARLPRVVRAVAQASGKEVDLVLEGEEVTIDRSLVELLADPLLHLTAQRRGPRDRAAGDAGRRPASRGGPRCASRLRGARGRCGCASPRMGAASSGNACWPAQSPAGW
jgi:two-component system chemotaxis sensor kinase CheA